MRQLPLQTARQCSDFSKLSCDHGFLLLFNTVGLVVIFYRHKIGRWRRPRLQESLFVLNHYFHDTPAVGKTRVLCDKCGCTNCCVNFMHSNVTVVF